MGLIRPGETAAPSLTPALKASSTDTNIESNPVLVWAVVTQDAACRAGPGIVYEIVGFLAVGQSALAHGTDNEGAW